MTLYLFGPVAFEVWPYNTHEVSREVETTFAEKAVVGRRPPLEHVGEGGETIKLSGRILPHKLPGGLEANEVMNAVRVAAKPQLLMRGDGVPLGWFVCTSMSEKSTFLDAQGVGQLIEIEITLKRDDPPDAASFLGSFASLYG